MVILLVPCTVMTRYVVDTRHIRLVVDLPLFRFDVMRYISFDVDSTVFEEYDADFLKTIAEFK